MGTSIRPVPVTYSTPVCLSYTLYIPDVSQKASQGPQSGSASGGGRHSPSQLSVRPHSMQWLRARFVGRPERVALLRRIGIQLSNDASPPTRTPHAGLLVAISRHAVRISCNSVFRNTIPHGMLSQRHQPTRARKPRRRMHSKYRCHRRCRRTCPTRCRQRCPSRCLSRYPSRARYPNAAQIVALIEI